MKTALLIVLGLLALGAGGFFFLAQKSKTGSAPGLVDGALAPCPDKPNCISSEPGTPESHAIAPLPASVWEMLPDMIGEEGGVIVVLKENYLAAEFATPTFGFVDDVEFRKGDDAVHVRSASRVGRSDMGANAKRIEALRAALAQ